MKETVGKYSELHFDIIERCRNNESKAQLELYRLYSHGIYNTCFRILKDIDKSEDATQETFINAFEKLHTFKGESTFGAWIKKIAIRKAIDELRRNTILFENIEDSNIVENQIEIFDDDRESESMKISKIKEALLLLPDGYRIVFTLHLFEGYDHEEISQILSITESTSRSQYTRAKQKLTELLTKKFGF